MKRESRKSTQVPMMNEKGKKQSGKKRHQLPEVSMPQAGSHRKKKKTIRPFDGDIHTYIP